jgi:hypothetical protein
MTKRLLLLWLCTATTAWADAPAKCRVRAIHALKTGEGVDAKLEELKPLLKKPPFDAFKSFKLLDEQHPTVELNKATVIDVPNGKKLSLTLLEKIAGKPDKPADKPRALLRLKVEYPGLATVYKVGEGDPIPLVVGAHGDGTLILAIDCISK